MFRTIAIRVLAFFGFGRKGVRKWLFLAAATTLILLGRWLEAVHWLEAVREFFLSTADELGRLRPWDILGRFGSEVTCPEYGSCDGNPIVMLGRLLPALITTFAQTMEGATGASWVMLLLSFVVGGGIVVWLWETYRGDWDDWNLFDGVALAILIPTSTSIAAVLLQGWATLLFGIFGVIIGFIIWAGANLSGVLVLWKVAKEIRETSEKLEANYDAVTDMMRGRVQPKVMHPPKTPPPHS